MNKTLYDCGLIVLIISDTSSKGTMISSDDEDDPRSIATSHIKLLLEKCSTLSKKAMHVESPKDTSPKSSSSLKRVEG